MPPEIEDLNDYQIPYWPTTPEGEERQAREVVEMYTALFESPYVQAITTGILMMIINGWALPAVDPEG